MGYILILKNLVLNPMYEVGKLAGYLCFDKGNDIYVFNLNK